MGGSTGQCDESKRTLHAEIIQRTSFGYTLLDVTEFYFIYHQMDEYDKFQCFKRINMIVQEVVYEI